MIKGGLEIYDFPSNFGKNHFQIGSQRYFLDTFVFLISPGIAMHPRKCGGAFLLKGEPPVEKNIRENQLRSLSKAFFGIQFSLWLN